MALNLLRAGVIGAIADDKSVEPQEKKEQTIETLERRIHDLAYDKLGLSAIRADDAFKSDLGLASKSLLPPLVVNGYEARVLQGIWAAAPYLHNGSVPSLTELLKPPAERTKRFRIGPNYDPTAVGLAASQTAFDSTLETTGCDDLLSGDSNCGHDFGTHLSAADKRALLEYLKIL